MLTLPRFFAATVGILAGLAGTVLTLAVRTAGLAVVQIGEAARDDRAARVTKAVQSDLGARERAVSDFQEARAVGAIAPSRPTGEWYFEAMHDG